MTPKRSSTYLFLIQPLYQRPLETDTQALTGPSLALYVCGMIRARKWEGTLSAPVRRYRLSATACHVHKSNSSKKPLTLADKYHGLTLPKTLSVKRFLSLSSGNVYRSTETEGRRERSAKCKVTTEAIQSTLEADSQSDLSGYTIRVYKPVQMALIGNGWR